MAVASYAFMPCSPINSSDWFYPWHLEMLNYNFFFERAPLVNEWKATCVSFRKEAGYHYNKAKSPYSQKMEYFKNASEKELRQMDLSSRACELLMHRIMANAPLKKQKELSFSPIVALITKKKRSHVLSAIKNAMALDWIDLQCIAYWRKWQLRKRMTYKQMGSNQPELQSWAKQGRN